MIAEKVLTTQEVADRFHELAQTGQFEKVQEELFADDAVSIEPPKVPGLQTVEGKEAIKRKGEMFNESVEEMHSAYSKEPIVVGNFFAVVMGLDATMKGMGRVKMDEIAIYEVREGKIVKEQFFF